MNLQHVNIKIFAKQADIDLVDATPIFHRWIQDSAMPELLIDVADYKHVPDGPGIMLIGHQADYSLDNTDGRLGLLYNRKAAGGPDPQAALKQAFHQAISASKLLEEEPAFAGKLRFDYGDVAVIVNDRALAPNDQATLQAVRPEIERFFAGIYGEGNFTVTHVGEPRDRFQLEVKANKLIEASSVSA